MYYSSAITGRANLKLTTFEARRKKNKRAMSNTPCADLYAVVDLTKKKAKTENTRLEIPVYHVLESTASNKDIETEEKASNSNDIYSVVDLSKKSSATKNKVDLSREKTVSFSDSDHQNKKNLFSEGITYNCLVLFAFFAAFATMCVVFIVIVILFSITYQKNITLEENFLALKKSFHNLNSSLDDTKTIIVSDAPPAKTYYLYSYSFPSSCLEIAKLHSKISDFYIVRSSTGFLLSVYCDLNRTFGGNSTGWMRVAELDANNCPPGMRTETVNTSTTCKVSEDKAGCTEIYYPVYNISYTQVTGRIRAYQLNTLDGFVSHDDSLRSLSISTNTLDSNYLDGVSITTNSYHIWSFAGGCSCSNDPQKPDFVGDHYICDGSHHSTFDEPHEELIWKNQQCNKNSDWFFRTSLPSNATDIRVRICRDQDSDDEDIALTELQIYVR